MSTQTMSHFNPDGQLGDVLMTGKYSDFRLKLPMYTFNVHKVVLCSKSDYFEVLCSSRFLEGNRGYVELSKEDDPALIARLLQVMYNGDYGTATHDASLSSLLRNALHEEIPISTAYTHAAETSYLTHAKMYALADAYLFPALSTLARSKFIAAINESDFAGEDIVKAIDVVYLTTPDSDDGLRKHVVYKSQTNVQHLKQLKSFQEVYEKYSSFNWDFGLEYGARKKVWCTSCDDDSELPSLCHCGFSGLCGRIKACTNLDWAALKCSSCKKAGYLVRDKPGDGDEVTVVVPEKRHNALTGSTASVVTAKKRKTM